MHRALFIILFPGALSATAMEQTQPVTPPVGSASRLERFAARNDSASLRELAVVLAGRIDLTTPGVRDGFSLHYAAGDFAQALAAYRDYFFAKLRDPGRFGIPTSCIAARPPSAGRSSADDLVANIVTARLEDADGKIHELRFDIGAPGAINWLYIPPGWHDGPIIPGEFDRPDYNIPDTKLLPNTAPWRKLPAAFARNFRDLGAFGSLLTAACQSPWQPSTTASPGRAGHETAARFSTASDRPTAHQISGSPTWGGSRSERLCCITSDSLDPASSDFDLGGERPVYRTASGDLQQPRSLGRIEISFQPDLAVDLIEHSLLRLAVLTVLCVNSSMSEPYFDAFQC